MSYRNLVIVFNRIRFNLNMKMKFFLQKDTLFNFKIDI